MSRNSPHARVKQLKEWWFMFNRTRRYKPRKKKQPVVPNYEEDLD